MVGEIELRISAANSIVVAAARGSRALTIDEDGANVRPLKNVAFHPEDRELLTRNTQARRGLAQLARLHLQESDVVRTNLAGDFHPVIDRHGRAIVSQTDSPGEESLIRSLPAKEKDA